jgi:hypothetical protein
MEIPMKTVSKAELGQLRPPSQADIQRSIDRTGWDMARVQNHQQMMKEITQRVQQFIAMQQPVKQQAKAVAAQDRPVPLATPRHQPVTKNSYGQERGRSVTEKRMHTPSMTHLPANVQQAMQRNARRTAQAEARQEGMQRLTDRTKGALRAAVGTVMQRQGVPKLDQPQRTRLQDLQAKVATEKRVEKKAERETTLFDKYLSKLPSRQPDQQRGKEHERGRDRTR